MLKIKVNASRHYEIKIEKGMITQKKLSSGFIITDKNVANIYPGLIESNHFIAETGEKSKSLKSYEKIIQALSESDEQRIIAFGGGVVGDLAGFVASTYKGGLELIQVPTTLLAMVDSSIGGKNGLNLNDKKNYIRNIYQPKEVLIDPLFLQTLPEKEFKNGFAEIIKYSAVFNKPDIKKLGKKSYKRDIESIISNCCQIKAKVVEKDEYDKGYRHTLNLGHTIGHAIELLCNLSHGDAISIGMIKELELGKRLGFVNKTKFEEIKIALINNKLPIHLPHDFDLEKAMEIMKYDKKGKFIFAFDKVSYNIKVDEKNIREVLQCA